jgi:hypothetical protein
MEKEAQIEIKGKNGIVEKKRSRRKVVKSRT